MTAAVTIESAREGATGGLPPDQAAAGEGDSAHARRTLLRVRRWPTVRGESAGMLPGGRLVEPSLVSARMAFLFVQCPAQSGIVEDRRMFPWKAVPGAQGHSLLTPTRTPPLSESAHHAPAPSRTQGSALQPVEYRTKSDPLA